MISAFAQIAGKFPGWSLSIFGEGPDRAELENLAAASPCPDRIFLPGETDQIEVEFAASDLFVIPSEFEGFGIVVLEAKRAGIPAIGFADCNGPNELIHPQIDGLLVGSSKKGDVADLAAAMRKLMADQEMRQEMGRAAAQSLEGYGIDQIGLVWERWLLDLTDSRGTTQSWRQALSVPAMAAAPITPPAAPEAHQPEAPETEAAAPEPPPEVSALEQWREAATLKLLFSGSPNFRALTISTRGFPGAARRWGWISFKLQAYKDQVYIEMRPNQSSVPLFDPTLADEPDQWGIFHRIPIGPGYHPRRTALTSGHMKPEAVEDLFHLIALAEQALAADPALAPEPALAAWGLEVLGSALTNAFATEEKLSTVV